MSHKKSYSIFLLRAILALDQLDKFHYIHNILLLRGFSINLSLQDRQHHEETKMMVIKLKEKGINFKEKKRRNI